jgi:hypothetical protein
MNAEAHTWKACWGQPLASSNLLSSGALTCGDAKEFVATQRRSGLLASVWSQSQFRALPDRCEARREARRSPLTLALW